MDLKRDKYIKQHEGNIGHQKKLGEIHALQTKNRIQQQGESGISADDPDHFGAGSVLEAPALDVVAERTTKCRGWWRSLDTNAAVVSAKKVYTTGQSSS